MLKKHLTLVFITLGVVFLAISAYHYPGGSEADPTAVGYNWRHNYVSNQLNPVAVNGMANTARPWAIVGVLLFSTGFGVFFYRFSERIKVKSAAMVFKYLGPTAAFAAFLVVIPSQHDTMVTLSGTLMLLVFFYITVFVLKSRLLGWKIASVVFLLFFYATFYIYYTHSWMEHMPVLQKTLHLVKIVWVLGLEYFTRKEDFEHIT